MSLQEKMKRLKLTPLPRIKQLIKEKKVESIVFRDKQDSMNANYTITYKQRDEDAGYVSYEFFIVK